LNTTNEQVEKEKGRLALWLDPEDLEFLKNEWRKIPENAPDQVKERWSRIAFRASSALHKAGVKAAEKFPEEHEKYRIQETNKGHLKSR